MHRWHKVLKELCYPHIIIVVIFTAISIFGLIYSFSFDAAIPFLQYLTYIISAYTLTIICFRIPNIIKTTKIYVKNNKLITRYNSDVSFRSKITLYTNTSTNLLSTLFYLIIGILDNSLWFYSLAIYYALLLIMRFLLLKNLSAQAEINLKGQWVRYRFCGIILIITNISFAAISFFVIRHGKGFSYHFIETIAIALFTFVITILAIVNSVRYRRLRQPIIKATKIVSLVSALVSMFSLETAMITVFGSAGDIYFKRIITTITGILVCFTIFVIGIVMIIKSTKEIKTIK